MTLPTKPTDMMTRTMRNLKFIRDQKNTEGQDAEEKVYEVTQLVNSFLGALASWSKHAADGTLDIVIADAEKAGWPHDPTEGASPCHPKTLRQVIKQMRDALAHGNIEFFGDGDIESVRLSTYQWPDRKILIWSGRIGVCELDRMLNKFVESVVENGGKPI